MVLNGAFFHTNGRKSHHGISARSLSPIGIPSYPTINYRGLSIFYTISSLARIFLLGTLAIVSSTASLGREVLASLTTAFFTRRAGGL